MQEMQQSIRDLFFEQDRQKAAPVKYFVSASKIPGIYNLGGDLGHFVERIRGGDVESMRHYAYECINVIHNNAHAFQLPVITIGLVQGDALGGGLECALSYDLIVAERSAKLGLPEVLFNLFPGMGAYSFLSRRMGAREAEKMIMSGRVYNAVELHDMGVVDVLAEDGDGVNAVRDYIARNSRKHNAHTAMYQARRRVNPVTYDELKDIVDIWVDAALRLTESDLRKMMHLTAAQNRRVAGATVKAAA
jgi:DSF synthase